MQDNRGTRPILFVMGLQERVINPSSHAGGPPAHIQKLTKDISDFVIGARKTGVEIVWLFHSAPIPKDDCAHGLVTQDFDCAKELLAKKGDAPIANLPVAADDLFWVLPKFTQSASEAFQKNCEALDIAARPALAVCGVEYEEPGTEGTYVMAHDLAHSVKHNGLPAILSDLTDNIVPVATNAKARANDAFLKRCEKGWVMWMQGRDWLDVVREATGPLPPRPPQPSVPVAPQRTPVTDRGGEISVFEFAPA